MKRTLFLSLIIAIALLCEIPSSYAQSPIYSYVPQLKVDNAGNTLPVNLSLEPHLYLYLKYTSETHIDACWGHLDPAFVMPGLDPWYDNLLHPRYTSQSYFKLIERRSNITIYRWTREFMGKQQPYRETDRILVIFNDKKSLYWKYPNGNVSIVYKLDNVDGIEAE